MTIPAALPSSTLTTTIKQKKQTLEKFTRDLNNLKNSVKDRQAEVDRLTEEVEKLKKAKLFLVEKEL